MKLKKALIKALEAADFSIYVDNDDVRFQKYSPEGQDFNFTVSATHNLTDLFNDIYDYYDNFDPSEEAYYWLDNSGHGKNGAPYDMGDLYNDMVVCKGYIKEAAEIIRNFL